MTWNELQHLDPCADDVGSSADESGAARSPLEGRVEAQLARAVHRLGPRPGSESGQHSAPVGVALAGRDEVDRRWRLPRRWRPGHAGLGAAVAVLCFGLIALMELEEVPAPESSAQETFSIDRVIQFEGGATIFSHGERDGDTIWLRAFELNWSDKARPAAQLIEDVDPAAEDGYPARADDVTVAEPIVEMAEDRPVVPARSTRSRAIPVKNGSSVKTIFFKINEGHEPIGSVHAVPLRQMRE